jgi:hypothetical protein
MNSTTWRPDDGQLLQNLRMNAGIDELVFARQNTLSLAQLRELESGVGHHFYNEPIKRNAGVKLLRKLGYEFPESTPEASDATAVTETEYSAQDLVHVVVPVAPADIHRPTPSKLAVKHPAVWMGSMLTCGLVAFVMLQGPTPSPAERPQTRAIHNGKVHPTSSANDPQPSAIDAQTPSASRFADPAPHTATRPEPLPLPAAQAHAPSRIASAACDDVHRDSSAHHTPSNPLKPGNYVYIEARSDSQLCVLDSQNKLSILTLKAGMNHTVNGLAPFVLHTSDWQGLQVFFQGRPVRMEHGNSAHLVLNSLPL